MDYTATRKAHLRTWRLWYLMNQRCDPDWRDRYMKETTCVFTVCDDWSREVSGEQGFLNFITDMGEMDDIPCLYRPNPSEAYGPDNCELGDGFDRAKHSKRYTSDKAQWARHAEEQGIPLWVYYSRCKHGLTPKQAATTKYKRKRKSQGLGQKLAKTLGLR